MTLPLATLNMFIALVLGALIGSERQVRKRTAGLRTNALVALAASGFVVFSSLYVDELSPTRVAAQVVSGIGFLGAGIIFRDGFTVHGLNTAATLWCSAAVGVLSGGGHWLFAIVMTGLVVFVNLGLRPLVTWIKKKTGALEACVVRLSVGCRREDEAEARGLLLGVLQSRPVRMVEMSGLASDDGQTMVLVVILEIKGPAQVPMDEILPILAASPMIHTVRWDIAED